MVLLLPRAPHTTCRASFQLLLHSRPVVLPVTSRRSPIPSSKPLSPRLWPPQLTAGSAELVSTRLRGVLLWNGVTTGS